MDDIHVTKKQHYVPREYLRPWCFDEEAIYCARGKKIFSSNLMGVANERYFYEFNPNFTMTELKCACALFLKYQPNEIYDLWTNFYMTASLLIRCSESDVERNELAQKFQKQIEETINCELENEFYPILKKLRNGDSSFYSTEPKSEKDTNCDETCTFLYLFMELNLRTKNMKNRVIKQIESACAGKGINPDNLWMLTRHQYATLLGNALVEKHFKLFLLEDKTNSLIAGDQPVLNSKPDYIGGEVTNLEFYCPITPGKAILLALDDRDNLEMSAAERDAYNKLVRDESDSQIYSNSEENLNHVLSLQ